MPAGRETEARAFYGALLGLSEMEKPHNLAGRGGCWFQGGNAKVHLGVATNFAPATKAHPAFLVRDLSALRAKLLSAGCPMKNDVPIEGFDRIFVDDPFGNRIELMQRTSNTK